MLIHSDANPESGPVCDAPHGDSAGTLPPPEPLTDSAVEAIADTFKILGDPTRIRILQALGAGERCVCEIAGLVRMSESAVSHQLRLLRGMRLVRPRRAGRQVFYALDDQHIVELLELATTHVHEPGAHLALTAPREQGGGRTSHAAPRTQHDGRSTQPDARSTQPDARRT